MLLHIFFAMRINFHNDDERPLLEQTNTTIEDFTNMIDSKGREEEGYEIVVAK